MKSIKPSSSEEPAIKRPGITDYASIVRPEICAAVAATVYAVFSIYGISHSSAPVFASITAFIVCTGAMSFSSYFSQEMEYRSSALLMAMMLSIIGILSTFTVNVDAPPLVAGIAAFSALYFWKLKRIMLIGNIAFAALAAMPFASVLLNGTIFPGAAFLPACVFLAAAGADIYRSVNGMMDDKAVASIAEKYGVNRARTAVAAFLMFAIVASFAPFGLGFEGYVYMLFALLADMVLLMAIAVHKNAPAITAFSMALMTLAFAAGAAVL